MHLLHLGFGDELCIILMLFALHKRLLPWLAKQFVLKLVRLNTCEPTTSIASLMIIRKGHLILINHNQRSNHLICIYRGFELLIAYTLSLATL